MKVIIANPHSDPNAIVPIFYIHLASDKVPDHIVTNVFSESDDVQLNVNCALHAIKYIPGFAMLSRNSRTIEGLRMQWSNIWKWLQFFHTFWIQNQLSGDRVFAYSAVTSMIALFTTQDDLVSTIRSTPGCLEMTVDLWRLNILAPFRTEITAFPPATILWERLCGDETRKELDHTVRLLGGNPDAAVHTLLQHFDAACDYAREDPAFLNFVDSEMDFICEYRHSDSVRNSLVSHHSVRSITKQLASSQSLDNASPASVADCIIKCCHYLRYALDWGDGISCVIESLEAQLLPALIGSNAFIPYMHANLVCHVLVPLTEILPKYLVYRSVCRAVARSFRNIDKERLEEGMTRIGPLWEAWSKFKALAEERLAFHAPDEGQSTHYVCGNKQVRINALCVPQRCSSFNSAIKLTWQTVSTGVEDVPGHITVHAHAKQSLGVKDIRRNARRYSDAVKVYVYIRIIFRRTPLTRDTTNSGKTRTYR